MNGPETTHCTRCGATTSLYACETCLTALRIELRDVAGIIPTDTTHLNGTPRYGYLPSLAEELDLTLSRQDALTSPDSPIKRQNTTPLPFKIHATEALWVLTAVLAAWLPDLGGPQSGTPRDLARWLLRHLPALTRHPHAGTIINEVTDAIHQARRAIDRPHDHRVFLGKCDTTPITGGDACRVEIYGLPDHHTTHCTTCGAPHNVLERQQQLRDRADGYLGTAPEIAGFLRATGMRVTPDMIRGYAHRGTLTPTSHNTRGHPTYRINDVLTVLSNRNENK